jgi:hypothetical protein
MTETSLSASQVMVPEIANSATAARGMDTHSIESTRAHGCGHPDTAITSGWTTKMPRVRRPTRLMRAVVAAD